MTLSPITTINAATRRIAENLGLIDTVMAEKRFARLPDFKRDDLRQECYFALHEAAQLYDESRGAFAAYASIAMRRRAIKSTLVKRLYVVESPGSGCDKHRHLERGECRLVISFTLHDAVRHNSPVDERERLEELMVDRHSREAAGRLSGDECDATYALLKNSLKSATARRVLKCLTDYRLLPPRRGDLRAVSIGLELTPSTVRKCWERIRGRLAAQFAVPGKFNKSIWEHWLASLKSGRTKKSRHV